MSDKFERYLNTYSGKKLVEKYGPDLNVSGIWEVRGEDPNCDWGGYHHMPRLGVYSGNLRSIVENAVEMTNFWTWGGGGDFTLLVVQSDDSFKLRTSLINQRNELQTRIDNINKQLDSLGGK